MMDYFEGVEVEVTSDGQNLPLYDDPDAPEIHNPQERQHYIEASPGAKFEIKVTLTENFNFGQSKVARIGIAFDGEKAWYRWIQNFEWLHFHNVSRYFSSFTVFCPVLSTWKERNFMFGSIDITESTNVGIHSAKLNSLGQIRLTIERMNTKTLRYPRPPCKTTQLSRVAEVSEKALKGSAISSTVSFTDGTPVAQPNDMRFEFVEIPGHLGECGSLTLLYRSKHILQMLGCLPHTPSSEAEPSPSIDNTTEATSHEANILRDQISDLRARLAVLEGIENVKSELPHTAGGIKRERDDNQSQSSSKRSRKPGRIETIDLTAD